jgi:hypothetical protein
MQSGYLFFVGREAPAPKRYFKKSRGGYDIEESVKRKSLKKKFKNPGSGNLKKYLLTYCFLVIFHHHI